MSAKLRVLLADDHGVLRAGLRALLDAQSDIQVVGEASTAETTVQLVTKLQPDVLLLDIRMPGGGLAALRQIKRERPATAVLILSQYDDLAYLREALAQGASGYALKRSTGPDLIDAVRIVARGEIYLHPAVAKLLVQDSWGPHSDLSAPAEPLSDREAQVVRLVAMGHTTQQVANALFLSVRTVETYKTRALDKLGLSGRAALVRYAMDHGLLELQPD